MTGDCMSSAVDRWYTRGQVHRSDMCDFSIVMASLCRRQRSEAVTFQCCTSVSMLISEMNSTRRTASFQRQKNRISSGVTSACHILMRTSRISQILHHVAVICNATSSVQTVRQYGDICSPFLSRLTWMNLILLLISFAYICASQMTILP